MRDVWQQFATPGVGGTVSEYAAYDDVKQGERDRRWRAACQAGRCRYVAGVEHENPPAVDTTTTCTGIHGTRYRDLDGGHVTWRWHPCPRQQAWWERRQEHLRITRPSKRRSGGYEE